MDQNALCRPQSECEGLGPVGPGPWLLLGACGAGGCQRSADWCALVLPQALSFAGFAPNYSVRVFPQHVEELRGREILPTDC